MNNFFNDLQLFAQVQTTTMEALSAEMQTFYDMTLIDEAGPSLVHEQFGQKRPIPANGGKIIEFRQFSPLPKALEPLTEGVTPNGQTGQGAILENDGSYYTYETAAGQEEVITIDGRHYMVVYETDATGAVTVNNHIAAVLPKTGGAGTHLYTVSGALLTAAALIFGIFRRRGYEGRPES